jgi:hypothetical protein
LRIAAEVDLVENSTESRSSSSILGCVDVDVVVCAGGGFEPFSFFSHSRECKRCNIKEAEVSLRRTKGGYYVHSLFFLEENPAVYQEDQYHYVQARLQSPLLRSRENVGCSAS